MAAHAVVLIGKYIRIPEENKELNLNNVKIVKSAQTIDFIRDGLPNNLCRAVECRQVLYDKQAS